MYLTEERLPGKLSKLLQLGRRQEVRGLRCEHGEVGDLGVSSVLFINFASDESSHRVQYVSDPDSGTEQP